MSKRIRVMGKVSHWGAVKSRVHMLHAIVPSGMQVGDVVIVHIEKAAKCPNWTCGAKRGKG